MYAAVTAAMASPNPKVVPSCRLVVVTRQKVGEAKKKHPFYDADRAPPSHVCAGWSTSPCTEPVSRI
jgi:hypothetical protein